LSGACGGSGFFTQATARFFLAAALALVFLPATLVFLTLARFGGFALLSLRSIAFGAALGVVFLAPAIFLLAATRIGEGARTGVALLVRKSAQDHAGTRRVRGPARTLRTALLSRCCGLRRRGSVLLLRSWTFVLASALADRATLHRLDHDRLRAAMGEALAHHALLDGSLQ
jgi:hypothetical protein